jgi:hypothetical protein
VCQLTAVAVAQPSPDVLLACLQVESVAQRVVGSVSASVLDQMDAPTDGPRHGGMSVPDSSGANRWVIVS